MTFEDVDDETGKPLWGVPRLSEHGAGWLIDYYDSSKQLCSVHVAKGDALEWCKRNQVAIAQMQQEVKKWLRA